MQSNNWSDKIKQFLTDAFSCRENLILHGTLTERNLSFGVRDYTDFPGQSMTQTWNLRNGYYSCPRASWSQNQPRRRAKSKVPASHKVTATNLDVGLQIISILNGGVKMARDAERELDEQWLQKMRTSSRIDQKTWSKAMPPMFQRSRTGNRFQEDELRRNKNAI